MLIHEDIHYQSDALQVIRPIEVWAHTKNFSIILEIEQFGHRSKAIYYPEKGVRFTTDIRVPKPYEVHHHIAYSALCEFLGWNVAIPAIPFSFEDDDHGALSPFYEGVEVKPHYFFKSLPPNDTWIKIVILDYLAGLIDRTSNDVLFLPDGTVKVTDNGLSFVEGTDFTTQISVIRKALRGIALPPKIVRALGNLSLSILKPISQYLYKPNEALDAVLQRKNVLLSARAVL